MSAVLDHPGEDTSRSNGHYNFQGSCVKTNNNHFFKIKAAADSQLTICMKLENQTNRIVLSEIRAKIWYLEKKGFKLFL